VAHQKIQIKEKYKIRGRFIAFLGSGHVYKNIENLVKAFFLVKKIGMFEDLNLVIIGKPESVNSGLLQDVS